MGTGPMMMKVRNDKTCQGQPSSVFFGQTEINYAINFCERKTLAIHVHPDGNVIVDAPIAATSQAIADKVKKKAPWIFKQQLKFASYPPALSQRQYVSGEAHRYLGRQYRLKVTKGNNECVKLLHGHLAIETNDPENRLQVKALLQHWIRLRAWVVFWERYAACVQQVTKLGITHHLGIQLRFMSKRWGSCTGQGNIILNPELVAAPKDCIDYVITHELCHLKERNHSPAFYKLLTSVMKDWELRRKRLNELVAVRFV